MERRQYNLPVAVEIRSERDPIITGQASVFYNEEETGTEYNLFDNVYERILPGAFDRAIRERDDVVLTYNHSENYILGRTPTTLKLSVDSRGLNYEGYPPKTTYAKDLIQLLKRGDISESSFAFQVESEEWSKEGDKEIRNITSVKLFDVSAVVRGAYSSTHSTVRKDNQGIEVRCLGSIEQAKNSYNAWKNTQERIDRFNERCL